MATNPKLIPNVVTLTDAQLTTIANGGSITVGDDSYSADLGSMYLTPDDSEVVTNKVTSLSSASTNTQYPSAKCVYDLIGDVESLLGGI